MNDGLVSLREASTPHAAQRREALQTQVQGVLAVRGDELRGTARPVKPNHAFENPNQEPQMLVVAAVEVMPGTEHERCTAGRAT